jgi:hypothetical protein
MDNILIELIEGETYYNKISKDKVKIERLTQGYVVLRLTQ